MAVKAKFAVRSITTIHSYGKDGKVEQKQITLEAVNGSESDNADWSKWTPSGILTMNITNPAAYEQFKGGQYVLLTLEPQE